MPANWKLRDLLKERGGNNASEISRIVLEQTGYQLSIQAVCNLLNAQPKMIRLETIQAICDSFYIRIGDFLDVFPSAAQQSKKKTASLERRGRKVDEAGRETDIPQPIKVRRKWISRRSIQMRESFHPIQEDVRNRSRAKRVTANN